MRDRRRDPRVEVGGRLSVESEVLRTLPDGFLFHYEQVWMRVVGEQRGVPDVGVASARAVTRLTTGQTETRGGAKAGKKLAGASEKNIIASEQALKFKRRIDAKLRVINREMKAWLTPASERVGTSLGRRCTVCKRFGEDGWLYCPIDGKPMEEREA
jgi:hypothetical protein